MRQQRFNDPVRRKPISTVRSAKGPAVGAFSEHRDSGLEPRCFAIGHVEELRRQAVGSFRLGCAKRFAVDGVAEPADDLKKRGPGCAVRGYGR